MLGGLDPIIIFQFSALAGTGFADQIAKIPVISQIPTVIDMPPIPIYLSRELTGLYVDTESKNVDIETSTETMSDGTAPAIDQKAIGSTVEIELLAKKNSTGLILLSSMIDLLYEKVTSKEYSITYIHGATTIFRGVLHSYNASQSAENDLLTIKISLSKGGKKPTKEPELPVVPKSTGPVPL